MIKQMKRWTKQRDAFEEISGVGKRS